MTRKLRTLNQLVLNNLLLLGTGLAACTVGPEYTPPKIELTPFHDTGGASSKHGHELRCSINDGPGSTSGS